jgi:transcription elongation GreA/GreB family factor
MRERVRDLPSLGKKATMPAMSRAFTKEDDAGEDLPELPVPEGPNYVTPRGFELLKKSLLELTEKKKTAAAGQDLRPIQRDLRYLESRLAGAIVVPPGAGPEIRFGARVESEDEAGGRRIFQIVGDDEARAGGELLAWSAPLAFAMLGAKTGDTVTWESPHGHMRHKIISVEYPR